LADFTIFQKRLKAIRPSIKNKIKSLDKIIKYFSFHLKNSLIKLNGKSQNCFKKFLFFITKTRHLNVKKFFDGLAYFSKIIAIIFFNVFNKLAKVC